jgi:hypothetical protein
MRGSMRKMMRRGRKSAIKDCKENEEQLKRKR